ncbi:hypothetical protein OSTOST_22590, partial [Ostertagia ostertagi]
LIISFSETVRNHTATTSLIRNVTSSGHHSNTTIGPILLNTTAPSLSGNTSQHVHQLNTTTSPQPLHITISPSNTTQHDPNCGANEVYFTQCLCLIAKQLVEEWKSAVLVTAPHAPQVVPLLGVKITRHGQNVQHVNGNVLTQIRSALSAIPDVRVTKDMLVTRQTSALSLIIAIECIYLVEINESVGTVEFCS